MADGLKYQIWANGHKVRTVDSKQVALSAAAESAKLADSVRIVTRDDEGKYTQFAVWTKGERTK